MLDSFSVSDLVQFKQEKTSTRRCWEDLPENYHYFRRGWKSIIWILGPRANYQSLYFPDVWSKNETHKFPMVITDFKTKCYSQSVVETIKNTLTYNFVQVLVFKTNGLHTNSVPFWVLREDIEDFSDKTYLQEFKEKLKNKLNVNNISSTPDAAKK
jgi:hypothetical protein